MAMAKQKNDSDSVEIEFWGKTPEVERIIAALDEEGISYKRREREVVHYDALGDHHTNIFILFGIGVFISSIKPIFALLTEYVKTRRVRIRYKESSIVSSPEHLNAAVDAIKKLAKAEARKSKVRKSGKKKKP
jgi:hypothetical protein